MKSWHSASMQMLISILTFPFKLIAFLILLFYEWGWEPLAKTIERLIRFRWMKWIEIRIARAPPWTALLLFLLPTLILLPFKLGALWLIAHGQKVLGVATIVLAKVVGTACVAWIFRLTHRSLMQLRWFAWVYPRVVAWKTQWTNRIKGTALWRSMLALKSQTRQAATALYRRFFK